MSSLPQGWHCIPVLSKNSSSTGLSGSSAPPVTIRKKWNSSVSSNIPQTKLPSYKSSNLRLQNGGLNNTYQIKPPIISPPAPQKKISSPPKPSPVKEYQNEISKLKKELATVKAENSILKAKVRRVDDENIQKGRQIEKMRVELKTLQKNESANINRKSKESQELLMLRQKCLRLENTLRDKDLTVKKLTGDLEKKDQGTSRSSATTKQKQIYQTSLVMQSKSSSSKISEKESVAAHSSLSRASLSLKSEVVKLRDMIHKLEKENKDLQQQAKVHCQEIRRLKVQLKSKDKSVIQTSSLKAVSVDYTKSKSISTSISTKKPQGTENKAIAHNVPKPRLEKDAKSSLQNHSLHNSSKTIPRSSKSSMISFKKNISSSLNSSSVSNETYKLPSNKQTRNINSKLPVTKSRSVHAVSKPVALKTEVNESMTFNVEDKADLECKIQEMRENIAAKKIQRSWREHQKNVHYSIVPDFHNGEKALNFIISSLKHHKLRKDKLRLLVKNKGVVSEPARKETFTKAVEVTRRKIYEPTYTS